MFSSSLSLLSSSLLISSLEAKSSPRIAEGLSMTFYESSCPDLETIVRNHLRIKFADEIGLAAGLLKIHYHDCFVLGYDASLLLVGTDNNPGEQAAPPNWILKPKALVLINELRDLIDDKCGPVISCADITALAARESVYLSGGPYYDIPYGRRDSLTFASNATTIASILSPCPTLMQCRRANQPTDFKDRSTDQPADRSSKPAS